ncbi:MAG: GNAT family N-acetyltransferase [Microgenomates group bacterium]
MRLVQPQEQYKESFIEAIKEFQSNDPLGRYVDLDAEDIDKNFSSYIANLDAESKGIDLLEGRVPQTTYWLIDNDEFIGRVRIRHSLNDTLMKIGGHIGYDIRPSQRKKGYGKAILKLVLPFAKKLGIDKALITCDVTNIASKKIIEANGGILENTILDSTTMPEKHRYWIEII